MKNKLLYLAKKYGFYAIVALCVVGIAAAAYLAVDRLVTDEPPEKEPQTSEQQTPPSQSNQKPSKPFWITPFDSFDNPASEKPPAYEPPTEEPPAFEPPVDEPVSAEPQPPKYTSPIEAAASAGYSGGTAVYDLTLAEWRTHNGIDFLAAAGTPVKAVYAGKVTRAGEDGLWGYTVEILLDTGITAVYRCISPVEGIVIGKRVEAGETVGVVGQGSYMESALEPHLHFELLGNGGYIDPLEILK